MLVGGTWPYLRRLETKSRPDPGLCGRNSVLKHRSQV